MSMPASLKAQLASTPSPTRAQLSWRTTILVAIGLATTWVMTGGGGPNVGARPPMFMGVMAFLLIALAAWTFVAGVSTAWWRNTGIAKAVLALPYAVLLVVVIAYARGPSLAHSFEGDLPCAYTTMKLAAIVGFSVILARRGTEPLRPVLKAFLFASFAAVIGAIWVFLACPLEEPMHFFFGHMGGALVAGGVLAGLAARVIRA